MFLVLTSVLLLPIFSLYFLKIYQNQLIQQTEAELIAQSAALSAMLQREIQTAIPPDVALGAKVPPDAHKPPGELYQPMSAEARTGQQRSAAAAAGRARAGRAGRSRLCRARRPHDAGSGRDPEA